MNLPSVSEQGLSAQHLASSKMLACWHACLQWQVKTLMLVGLTLEVTSKGDAPRGELPPHPWPKAWRGESKLFCVGSFKRCTVVLKPGSSGRSVATYD